MTERRIRTNARPSYGRTPAGRAYRQDRGGRTWRFELTPTQRKFFGLLVVAGLAAMGLWRLFAINTVTVLPATTPVSVTAAAKQAARGLGWHRNQLTFDSGAYATAIMKADPTISSVTTRRALPGALTVTVTLKRPSIGWATGNQSYLLDASGTVIGPIGGQTVPVVYDDSNLPVSAGQTIVSERFTGFVGGIAAGLAPLGLSATHYEVKDTTYDLYVTTSKGYQLILDTTRTPASELADLGVVLRNLKTAGKSPAAYIDLRIAGRAYYK